MSFQKLRSYDPNRVIVSVAGRIVEGFGDGDAIKVSPDGEFWTKQNGMQGAVTRSRQHRPGGQVSLTLQQTSPLNKYFDDLHKNDLLTLAGTFEISIRDTGGADLTVSPDAWVMSVPEKTYGKDAGDREWIFDCGHWTSIHGGSLL